MPDSNDNDSIAMSVSQDTATTAEELVIRRDGVYQDDVPEQAARGLAGLAQSKSTVNPFAGVK